MDTSIDAKRRKKNKEVSELETDSYILEEAPVNSETEAVSAYFYYDYM